jgi:hypothetical protein
MKQHGATLVAGSALGLAARKTYRLLTSGALTLDLDLGRRLQPLGPLVRPIRAPQDVVFDVVAAPYLGTTPRALADKLEVWERGADMVLAAHYTQVKCGITTTLETVRFEPTRTLKLPRAIGKQIGAPATMRSITVQAVPSSVAVGPDGALYVGELTGVPFAPGSARVWRVVPGRKPAVYASRFTTISDLAFDGRDLLVLELTTKGILSGKSPGALIRVSPRHLKTLVASAGLVYPTGLAVDGDSIYVSNNGLYPVTGPGPHGEVVRLARA